MGKDDALQSHNNIVTVNSYNFCSILGCYLV